MQSALQEGDEAITTPDEFNTRMQEVVGRDRLVHFFPRASKPTFTALLRHLDEMITTGRR